MAELWELSAEEAVRRLTAGAVSPLELVDASIARIEAVDGAVNALPLHRFERARDDARRLGGMPPGDRGLLAGLPIAIKDLIDVEGMRTTYGCPLYADNVAAGSDPLVTRLEARGGIVTAKSSSPEMGMMPVTTNRVFGHTRNPWNLETTPGGSSGGASAALAAGEVWLAHGSDIGGSLRIPAAFAGVCGLRPSPGRVPRTHSHRCFNPMSVQGPMARSVGDIALFLDAMAGYLASDPLSLPDPAGSFRAEGKPPARIGYVPDIGLGGVEPDVAAVVEGALAGLDIPVEPLALDFGDMSRLFSVMIGHNTLIERADFIAENRDRLEPVLGLLLDHSLALTAEDFIWAERERAAVFQRLSRAFEQVDVIVMPTVCCTAFSVEERGPRVDEWSEAPPPWFQQCWGTVLTSCPILAIPAGLAPDGMPVGLQIMAPVRREDMALAAGRAIEAAVGSLPAIDPRPGPAASPLYSQPA